MLRRLRRVAGLTQHEIAERVGVSYQQIHKYESGQNRMTVGWVAAFAAALGCRPVDFFADPADPPAALRADLALARRVLALPPARRRALAAFLDAFPPAAPGAAGEQQPAAEELQATARSMGTSGVRPDGRDICGVER